MMFFFDIFYLNDFDQWTKMRMLLDPASVPEVLRILESTCNCRHAYEVKVPSFYDVLNNVPYLGSASVIRRSLRGLA